MGYLTDTVKGVTWMGALRVSTRALAFAKIAIIARLLLPEQFGLFGIASLVLSFLEIITETGINIFLIQEKAELKEYLDTAWVVSIFRGIVIALVLLLFTPLIASFFSSPNARSLLYLIATVPFIKGFINPAIVRFQKDLQFNKEFLLRVIVFFFDAAVAIAVAFFFASATSLVWGMIAGAISEVIISHLLIKPKPKLRFESEKVRRVVNRGKWVTAAGFFNYLFREGDDIIVGRVLNTTSLGLYQVAYKISTLPITEISDVVMKVTFPVFTKISDDTKRLKKAFVKSTLVISALAIPFGILLFYFTRPFVLLLLGENWLGTVEVIRVLAAFGVIRAITAASYPLLLAVKRQKEVTMITFAGIAGLAITIFPLVVSRGIVGAGLSALIGALVALPVAFFFSFRVFKK